MKRTLRHLYGAGIMFFYFFKWPVLLGLPFMYFKLGLRENPILDLLWVVCLVLAVKDIVQLGMKLARGKKT